MSGSTDHSSVHETQLGILKDEFSAKVMRAEKDAVDCPVLFANNKDSLRILSFLKNTNGFEYIFLSDLTAYDDQGSDEEKDGRFVVVYNLFSPQYKSRIRVKVRLQEGEEIESAIPLWAGANWAEREVFDMFGIKFVNHPDLRRILMDQRFEGHPLRKDYYWRKYQIFTEPEPIPMHILEKKD